MTTSRSGRGNPFDQRIRSLTELSRQGHTGLQSQPANDYGRCQDENRQHGPNPAGPAERRATDCELGASRQFDFVADFGERGASTFPVTLQGDTAHAGEYPLLPVKFEAAMMQREIRIIKLDRAIIRSAN